MRLTASPCPASLPLQWYQNLRSIGYEHSVALTDDRTGGDCDDMAKLEPGMGCAWDGTQPPGFDSFAGEQRWSSALLWAAPWACSSGAGVLPAGSGLPLHVRCSSRAAPKELHYTAPQLQLSI